MGATEVKCLSGNDALYEAMLDTLTSAGTVELVRRALAQNVVLDTWMNGEREETFSESADAVLTAEAEELTAQALANRAVFPAYPMPEGYIRAIFQEMLHSTALYLAQKSKGFRDVDEAVARDAVARLAAYIRSEPDSLTAAARYYGLVSGHEDLNAIRFYRRMRREDFLLGTMHRPWSNMMLTNQLNLYRAAGLVKQVVTAKGEMLELTDRGEEVLQYVRGVLGEAGEFTWRSNAQRWVIFSETDYDGIYQRLLPDAERTSTEYIQSIEIPRGAKVLEIGAGTGRATFDLGLAARIAESDGTLIAMEPSAALMKTLRLKRLKSGLTNVEIVQGTAESLPFLDDSFDVVVSVAALHFMDVKKALAEMVRVIRPGGMVTAASGVAFNLLDIPMVSVWFRHLKTLADEFGVPLGERQGLPSGMAAKEFRAAGLERVETRPSGSRILAGEHRSFLQFVLKGAAFYQNILSRLPYQERWQIIRLLDETGAEIAATTAPEEQEMFIPAELVYARKPRP